MKNKTQSLGANSKMTDMTELSDKGLKKHYEHASTTNYEHA